MQIQESEYMENEHRREAAYRGGILHSILTGALVVAFGAIAWIQVGAHRDQQRLEQVIAEMADKNQARLDAIEERARSLEQDDAALNDANSAANTAIVATQRRLVSARKATEKAIDQAIEDQRDQTTQQITQLEQQQDTKLGEVNSQVSSVKTDLDDAKSNLNGVSSKLDQAVGDLGVHSGLIARNHDELTELRRKGEREYAEFDLKKAKGFTHVSDLSLRLTKSDVAHQKYSMAVMVADKNLQKNDKTALEPVQFYLPDGRKLVEIVVWDVNKDRITGYVSEPKS